MMHTDGPREDPILRALTSAFREVDEDHRDRQLARTRLDLPLLTNQPYLDVDLDTEQRTFTGRIFDLRHPTDTLVDLYPPTLTERDDRRRLSHTQPVQQVRLSAIVAVTIRPPILHAITRGSFGLGPKNHFDALLDHLNDHLDGSGDTPTLDLAALRSLADLDAGARGLLAALHNNDALARWDRYVRAMLDRYDIATPPATVPSDPRWTREILLVQADGTRHTTTVARFLTSTETTMPWEFLFKETREAACVAFERALDGLPAHKETVRLPGN